MGKIIKEEILDLVNEKDEVIGEIEKRKANNNPNLIHREVSIIVYDKTGKVLFQKRSDTKKVNPGVWTESASGHVPKGMTPFEAAHKELKEELGFDTNLEFLERTLSKLPNETHFTYWFFGKYPEKVIKIDKREVRKVKFLAESELSQMIKSGEIYDPINLGGYPEDMVKKFWKIILNI